MSELESLFAELLDEQADATVAKEARSQGEFQTIRTGAYQLVPKRAELIQASEKSPWPGRLMVKVVSEARDESGTRVGTVTWDVSPVIHRTQTGRLDGPTVLWGQLINAFFNGNAPSNREVMNAAGQYPVKAYVEEAFQTVEGYRTPKSAPERERFEQEGYPARNFVRNVKAVA